jgi:replicative DNA helicase
MNEQEFFKRLCNEASFSAPLLSGFRDLDELIHGGFSNELVTVASRPAHGKTAFLFNLMMNFSMKQDFKGIVAFPRMSQREFILYFTAWLTNIDVFTQGMNEGILEKIYSHYHTLSSNRVQIIHRTLTLEEIFTLAEINQVDYIILDDYFRSQIWKYDIEKYAVDFSKIQAFMENRNISVFVSVLTSRLAEKRGGNMRPKLCDVYRSDMVSSFSHKVIQLYRPDQLGFSTGEDGYSTLGLVELMLQQNSKGRTGTTSFYHRAPLRMKEDPMGNLRIEREGNPTVTKFFDDLD